ncbi:MAG: isochorismatase family cysteine hydrolase [Bacillus sp. (in: firmicutes)]
MNTKHPSKLALLMIDLINDFQFQSGHQLLQHTQQILPSLLQLKKRARDASIPIIYINDHYNLWQADYKKIIQKCQTENNAEYIQLVSPEEDDFFLIKPKHSAFYGTSLMTLLAHLEVDSLILTGIAGNICVLFTANDAYMREYTLLCPKDCIASADDQDNHYALTMMKNVLKAKIELAETIQFD